MKKLIFTVLIVVSKLCFSQLNLVPNPSFENTIDSLPKNWMSSKQEFLSSIESWYMPTNGTPDIFSASIPRIYKTSCFSDSYYTVGSQEPKSGDKMIGMNVYNENKTDYREYIQVKLDTALKVGEIYVVKAHVSLADKAEYAIGNLGINLSTDSIVDYQTNGQLVMSYTVKESEILDNTREWMVISDTIEITQPYLYLTIGNFRRDNQSTRKKVGINYLMETAYYFIDDVQVFEPCLDDVKISNDTIICIQSEVKLSIKDENWDDILWSTGSKEINTMASAGITKVKVSKNHCSYEAEVRVKNFDCNRKLPEPDGETIVPNIITPNNDGINDFFKVIYFKNFRLDIYNRWGKLVYRTDNYQNDWNAEGLVDGVYYYHIVDNNLEARKITGWVQVLR